jgi:hypothetical protein
MIIVAILKNLIKSLSIILALGAAGISNFFFESA